MKISEAKAECRRWLDYLDQQREKSIAIQRVASQRQSGTCTLDEARERINLIDRSPVVYDGARLAEAVKILIGE